MWGTVLLLLTFEKECPNDTLSLQIYELVER